MLQTGPGKNASTLSKACSVGRRTIFRDLQTLRDAGVPVEFDAKAQRYFIQPTSLVPPTDFTADEVFALVALATELGRDQGLPFYDPAYNAAQKLQRSLPAPLQKGVRRTLRAIRIRPTRPGILTGKANVYQQLVAAIDTRRIVQVEYESLTEWERITTKLRPYQLLFSQHSWYVIGHSSLHKEVRIFNLARIAALEVQRKKFTIPRNFDLDRHLRNAWHLIADPGRDSHVAIRFKSLVARNVAEVNWHKTQRIEFMPDGSIIFRVTVSGLSEIAWWILSYGDQAEVLQPARLRHLIAQRARNMADIYKGS
ncbi:MAG TPA: WYL domain-containing transcriptional regulator [Lacipirellulaceae bacterium]|nr:WYL domain-containing transcriptional regulator [Lacipirellulaceae bacterium]